MTVDEQWAAADEALDGWRRAAQVLAEGYLLPGDNRDIRASLVVSRRDTGVTVVIQWTYYGPTGEYKVREAANTAYLPDGLVAAVDGAFREMAEKLQKE